MWEFEKVKKTYSKDRSRKTRSAPTLGACSSNQGHAQDSGGASNPTTLPRRKQPGNILIQGCQSPTRRDLLSRLLRFLTLSQILQKRASSPHDSSATRKHHRPGLPTSYKTRSTRPATSVLDAESDSPKHASFPNDSSDESSCPNLHHGLNHLQRCASSPTDSSDESDFPNITSQGESPSKSVHHP